MTPNPSMSLLAYSFDSNAKCDLTAVAASTASARFSGLETTDQVITDGPAATRLQFLNSVPTSFALKDDQVDGLIKEGRELLRNNPVFQEFLTQINGHSLKK